jgi:hypothetical protein
MKMKLTNCAALVLSVLVASGCAALDQVNTDLDRLNKGTQGAAENFFRITDSVATICKSVENNYQMATSRYGGRVLTTAGEVDGILDTRYPSTNGRFQVTIISGPFSITSHTNNGERINGLEKGHFVQVTGTVTNLSFNSYDGCRISLKNSTYQEVPNQ